MMTQPVFSNTKSISVYFGAWILLMGIHFSIFYFVYYFPLEIAIADSFVYNFLFSIIGISMWYVVRYSIPDQKNLWNVAFNHLAFLTLALIVWIGVAFAVLSTLFSSNKVYLDMLSVSIPNKILSGTIFYIVIGLAYYLYIYYVNLQKKVKVESRLRLIYRNEKLLQTKSEVNKYFVYLSLPATRQTQIQS